MRRAAKVDDNQEELVKALRKMGATVAITSAVGSGFPDAVVGFRGVNELVEIKDGSKSPSRRKLTDDQVEFLDCWRGSFEIIECYEDAKGLLNRMAERSANGKAG